MDEATFHKSKRKKFQTKIKLSNLNLEGIIIPKQLKMF